MRLRHITILSLVVLLSGCVPHYAAVKNTDDAAFIRFERQVTSPLLGSITRYVKVDDKQKCDQGYMEYKLLAVHNKGNPLVSDLNVDGLYVNPGYFRILMNTIAGGARCDVFVGADIQAGQKYKVLLEGNAYIGANKCSAKNYKMVGKPGGKEAYEEMIPVEYKQCNL